MNIPVSSIAVISNVRSKINTKNDSWKSFVADINTKGILTALSVYEDEGEYYLLYGHRRLKALQELGVEEAPVCIFDKPNGDLANNQISENLMREDLSLYDEVMAFKSMTEDANTVQDVADKFGHSPRYVRKRLNLANLMPTLLKPNIISEENIDDLLNFASHSHKIQNDAIKWSMKQNNITKAQVIKRYIANNEHSWTGPYEYPSLSNNKLDYDDFIQFVGGKDKLKELQDDYGYKHQLSGNLFDEFYSEDYCNEPDFIKFVCYTVNPDLYNRIYEGGATVKKLDRWGESTHNLSYHLLFSDHNPKSIIETISAVDLTDAPYKITIKTRSKSDELKHQKERTKYYMQTKKFGRVLAKDYVDYLKEAFFNVKGNRDHVIIWAFGEKTELNEISVNSYQNGFNLDRIKKTIIDSYGKDERFNDVLLGTEIVNALILESIYCANYKSLNRLAKILKADTLKNWFNNQYTEGDERFITNVLSCFTTKNLIKISKGKKSDIVQYAVQNKVPFPFKDVFASKEAEWDTLSLKHHYLDKKTLYNT
jgi:ParB/RepB/Spo0J family partition protein